MEKGKFKWKMVYLLLASLVIVSLSIYVYSVDCYSEQTQCTPFAAGADALIDCTAWCGGPDEVQRIYYTEATCFDSNPCTCKSVWLCVCKDQEYTEFSYWETSYECTIIKI